MTTNQTLNKYKTMLHSLFHKRVTKPTLKTDASFQSCTQGFERSFTQIKNIHICN